MDDVFSALQAIQQATNADAGYRQTWLQQNAAEALQTGKVRYPSGVVEDLTPDELKMLEPYKAQQVGEQMNAVSQSINADLEYRNKYLEDNWMRLASGVDTQRLFSTFDDVGQDGRLLRESQPIVRNRIPKVKYPSGVEEPVTKDELEFVLAKRAEYVQQLIQERPGEAMSGFIRRPIGENESFQRDASGNLVPSMYQDVPLELTPAERLQAAQEHYRRSTEEGTAYSQNRSTTADPMYWVKRISFVGPSMKASFAYSARDAITRIADDQKNGTNIATEDDYAEWARFQENARIEAERSGSWPTWWLDSITAVPGYVGEFIATAGLVSPVSRGATAMGLKKFGDTAARRFVARAGGNLAGEAAVRTALRPGSVMETAERYRTPEANVVHGPGGPKVEFKEGMGAGEAYARGVGLTAAENVSETFLGDVVAPLLPKNMPKVLKFAIGDAEKGTLWKKIQDKTKVNGLAGEYGDEYLNDILSYPLQTKDERQRNVVDAVLRGDYEAVAKDFLEKGAVLIPTVGVSHGVPAAMDKFEQIREKHDKIARGEDPSDDEAVGGGSQPRLRGWIGTSRDLTPEELQEAKSDPRLLEPYHVNDLARRMRTSLGDEGSRSSNTYREYGRDFAVRDPEAADALLSARRTSLAKIREHFPAFPDISSNPGDPDVRKAFVDGVKFQLESLEGLNARRRELGLGEGFYRTTSGSLIRQSLTPDVVQQAAQPTAVSPPVPTAPPSSTAGTSTDQTVSDPVPPSTGRKIKAQTKKNGPEEDVDVGTPGFRRVASDHSKSYLDKGGWKLHLQVKPENYGPVDEWLYDNFPGQYKVLAGGDPGEKDFTIYVGSRVEADDIASRMRDAVGDKLESPQGVQEDVAFNDKVIGRFDIQAAHTRPYKRGEEIPRNYGLAGVPFDQAAGEDFWFLVRSRESNAPPQQIALLEKMVEQHRRRIEKDLAARYGEYFTGKTAAATTPASTTPTPADAVPVAADTTPPPTDTTPPAADAPAADDTPAPLESAGEIDSDEPPAGMTDPKEIRAWRRMQAIAKKKSAASTQEPAKPTAAPPASDRIQDDWEAFKASEDTGRLLEANAEIGDSRTITQATSDSLDVYDANVNRSDLNDVGERSGIADVPRISRAAAAMKHYSRVHGREKVPEFLAGRGLNEQQVRLATEILDSDAITQLLSGNIDAKSAAASIVKSAKSAGIPAPDMLGLLTLHYKADAASRQKLRDIMFAKKGNKLFVAKERFGILEEIIYGNVQETPWLASRKPGQRVEPEGGGGYRGNARFAHGTAVEFGEFAADKDAGNNFAGPGVYVVDEKDADVAQYYADRAVRNIMQMFREDHRERITSATKEQLESFVKFADAKASEFAASGNDAESKRWARASEILTLMKDQRFGSRALTVEFTPKRILDLGAIESGGRVVDDAEHQKWRSIFPDAPESVWKNRRAFRLHYFISKAIGGAEVNRRLKKAGYDSIHFVHWQGGHVRPYSAFVILNAAEARISKSPTGAAAEAATENAPAEQPVAPSARERTVAAPSKSQFFEQDIRSQLAKITSLADDDRNAIMASLAGRAFVRRQRFSDYVRSRIADVQVDPESTANTVQTLVTDDGRAILRALGAPKVGDFMRELANVWREELTTEEQAIAERYAGVKDGVWTDDAWNTFGNGFAKWVSSPKKLGRLQSVFSKIAGTLKRLMKNVFAALPDLEPEGEVARLYDSLLDSRVVKAQTTLEEMADSSPEKDIRDGTNELRRLKRRIKAPSTTEADRKAAEERIKEVEATIADREMEIESRKRISELKALLDKPASKRPKLKDLRQYIAEEEDKYSKLRAKRLKPRTDAQKAIDRFYTQQRKDDKAVAGVLDEDTVGRIPFNQLPEFAQKSMIAWSQNASGAYRDMRRNAAPFDEFNENPSAASNESRATVFASMMGLVDNRPKKGVPLEIRDSMENDRDHIAWAVLQKDGHRDAVVAAAIESVGGPKFPDSYGPSSYARKQAELLVDSVRSKLAAVLPDGARYEQVEYEVDSGVGDTGGVVDDRDFGGVGVTEIATPFVNDSTVLEYLRSIERRDPLFLDDLPPADIEDLAARGEAEAYGESPDDMAGEYGDAAEPDDGDTDFGFGDVAAESGDAGDASFDFGANAPPQATTPSADDDFTLKPTENAPKKEKGPEFENGPTVTPSLFPKGGLPGQTSIFENPDVQYDDVKTAGKPEFTKTPQELAKKAFLEMTADEKKRAAAEKAAEAASDFADLFKNPPMTVGLDPRYISASLKLAQAGVMHGIATFEQFIDFAMDTIGPDNVAKIVDYLANAWEMAVEDTAPGGEFAGMDLKDPVVEDAAAVVKKVRTRRESQPKTPAVSPPAPPAKTEAPTPPGTGMAPAGPRTLSPPRPEVVPPSVPADPARQAQESRDERLRRMRMALAGQYGITVQNVGGNRFSSHNSATYGSVASTHNIRLLKGVGANYDRRDQNWYTNFDPTEELYRELSKIAPERGAPGYLEAGGLPPGITVRPDGRLSDPSPVRGHDGAEEKGQFVTARYKYTEPVDTKALSPDLVRNLKPIQQQGVVKAIAATEKNGGFLFADGPGVGKTRQLLAVAKHFADKNLKVLIVSVNEALEKPFEKKGKPKGSKGVLGGSYKNDAAAMGIDIELLGDEPLLEANRAKFQNGRIYITTYVAGKFIDKVLGEGRRGEEGMWRMVDKDTVLILDEAHKTKNLMEGRDTAVQINNAIEAAKYVIFATATPGDKVYHMAYLKRAGLHLGMSEERFAQVAGLVAERDKQGRLKGTYRTAPGMSDTEALDRLSLIWDHMTRLGMMVKRELSLDGVDVEMMRVSLSMAAHRILKKIQDAVEMAYGEGNRGARKILLTHWRVNQEPFKVAAAMDQIKAELAEGRQVIVFAWRVNENETSVKMRDPMTGERVVIPIAKSEGTMVQLGKELDNAKIEYARLFGGSNAQANVAAFQSGQAKVILATAESGGTGINLDDVKGDAPRTIIVMTLPQDSTSLVQMLGRAWRQTTKSGLRVKYLVGDTEIDEHATNLIAYKLRTLNAFVRGEAGKFDPENAPNVSELDAPDDEIERVLGRATGSQAGVQINEVPLNMDENRTRDGRKVAVYHPMNIIAQMARQFDLPYLRGRMQSPKSKGFGAEHSPHYGTVTMEYGRESDLGHGTHELAHELDMRHKFTDASDGSVRKGATKLGPAIEKELQDNDYIPAERRAYEGWAEFLRMWMGLNDVVLQAKMPATMKWWNQWLQDNPGEARKLNTIRTMVRDYVDATPSQRMKVWRAWSGDPLGKPPKMTRETVASDLQDISDHTMAVLVEKARALEVFGQEYMRAGGKFDVDQDFLPPAMLYEGIDMARQRGFSGLYSPITSFDGKSILAKSLVDIIAESGFQFGTDEYAKFADYYQAKRALRINDANPKYLPPAGREMAERNVAIVESDPVLRPKAEAFADQLTNHSNAMMQWMRESGAITSQQEADMLDAHGEDYASLLRETPEPNVFEKGSYGQAGAGTTPYKRLSEYGSGAPVVDPIAAMIIKYELAMMHMYKRRTEISILKMLRDANVRGMGRFGMIVKPTMKKTAAAIDQMLKQLQDAGLLKFDREIIRGVELIREGMADEVPMTHLKKIAKQFGVKVKWGDQASVDAFINDIENNAIQGIRDVPSNKGDIEFWKPVFDNDEGMNVVFMRDANGTPVMVRLSPAMYEVLGQAYHMPTGYTVMMANALGRVQALGAVVLNPSWAVANVFADMKGSMYNAREQDATVASMASNLASLPFRLGIAGMNAWMPNLSRKVVQKALKVVTGYSDHDARIAANQFFGGKYWEAYMLAGLGVGHSTGTDKASVNMNMMRIFGMGLGKRIVQAAKTKDAKTLLAETAGTMADFISFSDSPPRFLEFSASLMNQGFFESDDGKWVKRTFDAQGNVASEVKYEALPEMALLKATAAARDASVNFWRGGMARSKWGKALGPFMWSALGGTNMLRRNLEGFWNHPDPEIRAKIRKRVTYAAIGDVMATAFMWFLNHDEDWYKENLQRDARIIYKYHNITGPDGRVKLRIKRGYNYSTASLLTEATLNEMENEMKGSGRQAAMDMLRPAFGQLVHDQVPHQNMWGFISQIPAIGPWVNVASNKGYDSRDIVPREMQDMLPGAQVRPNTSIWARKLGELFPRTVSPLKWDYYMDQMFGGFPGNYIDSAEAFSKGYNWEGIRRLLLRGVTPQTENQESVDALFDRRDELRMLDRSEEWMKQVGVDAEEPEDTMHKEVAYATRMLSAIGRDSKGFTREERFPHDALKIGTARAALRKEPLKSYPDAFSKSTKLPSESLEKKRDQFLLSFVRSMSSSKPPKLTKLEKEAGMTIQEKIAKWEMNRVQAAKFMSSRGWTAEDAVRMYRDRYGKEYGSEALSNASKRIRRAYATGSAEP